MNISKKTLLAGLFIATSFCVSSCHSNLSISESIDSYLFEFFGGTLFEKPSKISLKEIHLDDGRLQGKKIVVEGAVSSIGDHYSYVIITDKSARMLVLLNRILDADKILNEDQKIGDGKQLRVLGTIYKGKKGLPYISAISLNLTKQEVAKKT